MRITGIEVTTAPPGGRGRRLPGEPGHAAAGATTSLPFALARTRVG